MNRPARPRPPALRPARCEKMRPGRYRRIRSGARVRAAQRPSRTVAGRLIAERRACRCRNPGSARQVARPRRELRPGRRGPARTDRGIQARRRERARTARPTVCHGKTGHRVRPRPARHRGRRGEPVPPADRRPGPPRTPLRRVRHRARQSRELCHRARQTRELRRRARQSRKLRRHLPGPRPGGQGPRRPLRVPAGRRPALETGRHRPAARRRASGGSRGAR